MDCRMGTGSGGASDAARRARTRLQRLVALCACGVITALGCSGTYTPTIGGAPEPTDSGAALDAIGSLEGGASGTDARPSADDAGSRPDAAALDGATLDATTSAQDGPSSTMDSMSSAQDGPSSTMDSMSSAQDGLSSTMDATTQSDGHSSGSDTGVAKSDASIADGSSMDSTAADGRPGPTYASCLAILKAEPESPSGTYVIRPGEDSLTVRCDMSFADGGWTLVQSTNGGTCSPATEAAGAVTVGSCAYMPTATVMALAKVSTTVHVRTPSLLAEPLAYVTSVTTLPIQNLQMGLVLNANEAVGDPAIEEAAWTVVGDPGGAILFGRTPQSILDFTCSVTTDVWPGVYRACGNGADGFALDVTDKTSVWNWELRAINVPMEVYVR
jgi:hypothetical protein